jgi:hypothetical protein
VLIGTWRGRAAAAAAALLGVLPACSPGVDHIGGGGLEITDEATPPPSLPASDCPASGTSPAAVYGAASHGLTFLTAGARGPVPDDATLTVAAHATGMTTLGRTLILLYDSGRTFALDTLTCRELARHDLSTADLGVPAQTDLIVDGLARSGGPATSTWIYGRYSPPGRDDYGGFVIELDKALTPGAHTLYQQHVVQGVWTDPSGPPLVLLDDGTVMHQGQATAVIRPAYRDAAACLSLSRGSSGIWVSGGQDRRGYVRLPNGRTVTLPTGAFPTPILAHGRRAVVLLRSRAEAWFITDTGHVTTVHLGELPTDALTIGGNVLLVARDAARTWLVRWSTSRVVASFPVPAQPTHLLALT